MPDDPSDQAEPKPIDVYEAIAQMVDFMSSLAWQKMGLQNDLATGKIHQDLEQAKAAVDATAELVKVLEPALDEEADRRQVQNLVRDLRINYVQKSGEGS
ncbi:MAG: DUF1844 domain-containing protein [Armatimonadetes bacterium]|nr:DUF1844 domain-containing protein [Armatimonadota bacterium]